MAEKEEVPVESAPPPSDSPEIPVVDAQGALDALSDPDAPHEVLVTAQPQGQVRNGKVGRPSQFTQERRDLILGALRAGNYVNVALTAAGVPRGTYYGWIRQGRLAQAKVDAGEVLDEGELEYLEFFLAIPQAEAEAEVRLVTMWAKAAATDWRAAERLLARRHSARWKEVVATEVSGADGMPLAVAPGQVDDDGIAALARELEMRKLGAASEIVDAEIVEDED